MKTTEMVNGRWPPHLRAPSFLAIVEIFSPSRMINQALADKRRVTLSE
jgi:hypothetical protein